MPKRSVKWEVEPILTKLRCAFPYFQDHIGEGLLSNRMCLSEEWFSRNVMWCTNFFSDKRERTPSGSTIIMSLLAQVIPILHKNSWQYCLFFQVQFVGGVIVRRSVKFYYWFFVLVVMFNRVLIFSLIQQPDVLLLSLVTWTCSFVTSLAHIETQYQISIKLIDVKMIFWRWSCAPQLQHFGSSPSRVSSLLLD